VPAGDLCDLNQPFGECEAGTACIELGQPEGRCEQLCNPFGSQDGRPSSCGSGESCFPFGVDVGICVPSLTLNPGDVCSRVQGDSLLSMCRDQSICTRGSGRDYNCLPLCRLDAGNADCSGGTRCRNAPVFNDIPGLGVCR